MLNRKLTKDRIDTKQGSWVRIEGHRSGHVVVVYSLADRGEGRKRGRVLTNVTSSLSGFERRAVLVHAYKVLEAYVLACAPIKELNKHLRSCNYAEVFGSPWL